MIVKVTQEHIDKGRKSSCVSCPVALAFEEAGKLAFVGVEAVRPLGGFIEARLPVEATRFIRAFDRDEQVTPFEFEVEL